MRRRAKNATKNCNKVMVRKACTANPPSIYNVNDEVLVRIRCKTHKLTKRHAVLNGAIVKRNLGLSRYKVKFSPLGRTDLVSPEMKNAGDRSQNKETSEYTRTS